MAVWTRPVPSVAVTKSASRTEWARGPVLRAGDEVERRLVADPFERRSGECRQLAGGLPENPLHQVAGDDQHPTVVGLGADVGELGRGGDRGVGDERPRRRRPHDELVAGLNLAAARGDREPHVHRGVDDVAVGAGLAELVAGERRPIAGAVRDDLQALVQQPLLVDRLQRPPHRLDVVGVKRAVRVVEVDPEADPLGEPVPVLDVAEHLLAAAGVELGDPVALDVGLRGEAELGLDGELDGQSVAVPTALALDPVAAHRAVPGKHVLEHPGEHVVGARGAVRGRRPLVEHPRIGALAAGERLREHVLLAPALQHALLQLGERGAGIDGPVGPGHGRSQVIGAGLYGGACAALGPADGRCTRRSAPLGTRLSRCRWPRPARRRASRGRRLERRGDSRRGG